MRVYLVEWGACDENGTIGVYTTLEAAKQGAEDDYNQFKTNKVPLKWLKPEPCVHPANVAFIQAEMIPNLSWSSYETSGEYSITEYVEA
jgi:hypothetical protein